MTMTTVETKEENKSPGEIPPPSTHGGGMLLALRAQDPTYQMALEPASLDALLELSEKFAKRGICGITSAEDMISRVMAGRDLGLTCMQSLLGLYTIDNKPALYAATMHALMLRSPLIEEFRIILATAEKATVRVKRRGEDAEDISFTVEEARAADLVDRGKDDDAKKKNNWNRYRADMLVARCISRASKRKGADVIKGFSSVEELRDAIEDAEIVTGGERAPFKATIHGATRDFEAELHAIETDVAAVTPETGGRHVRERIEDWDAPETFKKRALDKYNTHADGLKKQAKTPKAPASDPAGQSTLPVT